MWEQIKYWFKHHNYAWKYKLEVCLPLFAFLVAVDWATKIAVQFTMTQGDTMNVMPGFMRVGYIINPGSAYGGNAGSVGGSIAIAAVITVITFVIIMLLNDKMWLIAIVFIFSGSFANLIARSWSPAVASGFEYAGVKGGVIDFMQWGFHTFDADSYIFNWADLCVNVGVILLIVFIIVEIVKFFVQDHKKKIELLNAPKANDDPDSFGVREPRLDETREEYDEPELNGKQKRAKPRLEKDIRENKTDRKATMYEQERIKAINDRTLDIQQRIKEVKAQIKLEKMQKRNEHKSN